MKRFQQIIISFILICLPIPVSGMVDTYQMNENNVTIVKQPEIKVEGNTLSIYNAKNLYLVIYNVTGVSVMSQRIASDSETISLDLGRGIYIIKLGKEARKIVIP